MQFDFLSGFLSVYLAGKKIFGMCKFTDAINLTFSFEVQTWLSRQPNMNH